MVPLRIKAFDPLAEPGIFLLVAMYGSPYGRVESHGPEPSETDHHAGSTEKVA